MKRLVRLTAALILVLMLFTLAACGAKKTDDGGKEALKDGTYQIEVTLTGGTGRASVASPTELEVKDGKMTATIIWSSPNYDYMIVDDERYLPEIIDNHSVFKIPVAELDKELPVIGDTVAMSTPHEIEYTLYFDSSTLKDGAAS